MDNVSWELIILIIIVGLIAFAVLGIYIGTRISSDKKRIRELESELADTRKELEGYRSKVNDHFKKTSELFTQMTSTYKAVYLHLAEGSHDLCTTDAALLNPSNGEFLKVTHEVEQQAAEAVIVQAAEKSVDAAETTETASSDTSSPAEAEKPEQQEPAPVSEAEIPAKPEPTETAPGDTSPAAEAEKPEQQEPTPVAEEAKEEAEEPAEPVTTPEDRMDLDTEKLKAAGF